MIIHFDGMQWTQDQSFTSSNLGAVHGIPGWGTVTVGYVGAFLYHP